MLLFNFTLFTYFEVRGNLVSKKQLLILRGIDTSTLPENSFLFTEFVESCSNISCSTHNPQCGIELQGANTCYNWHAFSHVTATSQDHKHCWTLSQWSKVLGKVRWLHPNVTLVSDEAAQGWGANVLVMSWLASRREIV